MGHGPRCVRVDRMEDVMLGGKRTISFWRPKKRLLSLERALAPDRQQEGRPAVPARAVAAAQAKGRVAVEGKRKARFTEHA
jgi:hypothetical protein